MEKMHTDFWLLRIYSIDVYELFLQPLVFSTLVTRYHSRLEVIGCRSKHGSVRWYGEGKVCGDWEGGYIGQETFILTTAEQADPK